MKKIMVFLAIVTLCVMLKSCLFLWDDTGFPQLKDEKDAYYAIVEAHALKQVWMYDYFKTFSNNYSQGQLFEYEPTQKELDEFLGQLAELMTYEAIVDSAIMIIQNAENGYSLSTDNAKLKSVEGLFSSMSAFYKWGRNAGQRARERTELIVSNMSDAQKSQLFNELLRDNWKNEFTSEAEFWTKLKNGDLDDKAPQIYNDFYYNSSYTLDNNFVTLANDQGLTPGKIVAKEGAEGIGKGAEVYVEAVKIATPLGKGADVLEDGRKWWEKAEKAVDKPLELVKDEIVGRAAKKLAGFVDVDGIVDAAGLGEATGSVAKGLMDLSFGSDDPADIIEQGLEWGIAKISRSDSSIVPEVVVAEKQNSDYGFPNIVLGVGNYVNELGETLMALPSGKWNMTAVDAKSNSASTKNVSVVNAQYTQVNIGGGDSENNDPNANNGCDSLNIHTDIIKYIYFEMNTGEQQFLIENKGYKNPVGWSKVNGTHNYFTTQYDYKFVEGDIEYHKKLFVEGTIITDGLGNVLLNMSINEINQSYYNESKNRLSKQETNILVVDLPAVLPWTNCVCGGTNGLCKYNFGISKGTNSYLWNSLGSIVSFNYKYSTYYVNQYDEEIETTKTEQNEIINNNNQFIIVRLSGN